MEDASERKIAREIANICVAEYFESKNNLGFVVQRLYGGTKVRIYKL